MIDPTRRRKFNAARSLLNEIEISPRPRGVPKTECQKFVRVDCVLPPEVKLALDLACGTFERARSGHIERALRLYLELLGHEIPKPKSPVKLPDTL